MRKIIAAMEMSLDGFIEDPEEKMDWVESWDNPFEGLYQQIDTCILGGGMYPGYETYWAAILTNPKGIQPFSGKAATNDEIEYAHFAVKTPHFVLSKTLEKVNWKTAQIIRDVEKIRDLKNLSGKDIYAVGGATLISSLMNLGLIDELRLSINPIVLGGGKALFKQVKERHRLTLIEAKTLKSDKVYISYRTSV
jgi:dihydrofolate reductase